MNWFKMCATQSGLSGECVRGGRSLQSRIENETKFFVPEAVRTIVSVCKTLEAAHVAAPPPIFDLPAPRVHSRRAMTQPHRLNDPEARWLLARAAHTLSPVAVTGSEV